MTEAIKRAKCAYGRAWSFFVWKSAGKLWISCVFFDSRPAPALPYPINSRCMVGWSRLVQPNIW